MTLAFVQSSRAVLHPRAQSTRFSTRVAELDSNRNTLGVNEVDDALERSDLGVLPESRIFGGDLQAGWRRKWNIAPGQLRKRTAHSAFRDD
jgi:hypothetical protein